VHVELLERIERETRKAAAAAAETRARPVAPAGWAPEFASAHDSQDLYDGLEAV